MLSRNQLADIRISQFHVRRNRRTIAAAEIGGGEPCPDAATPLPRAQRCSPAFPGAIPGPRRLNSARGRIRNASVRAALLLRRSRPRGGDERLVAEARAFARSVPVPVRLQVCVSLDGAASYVYAWINSQVLSRRPARGTRRL